MKHQDKTSENKTTVTAANIIAGKTAVQLKDNREHSVVQKKLSAKNTNQESTVTPVQRKNNTTGLSDTLKSGIENLSGHSMDDVKVHYNSQKPAQLQAHAYAQGTNIHLASGQEKHLPHEAWHVVQQKQGRVKPTLQMKGKVNVNDNKGLENEADIMGAKAISHRASLPSSSETTSEPGLSTVQRKENATTHNTSCGCASCNSTPVATNKAPEVSNTGVYQLVQCGTCGQNNSHAPNCPHKKKNKPAKKPKKANDANIVGGSHNRGAFQKSGAGGDQHQQGFTAAINVEKRTGFYADARKKTKKKDD